MRTLQEQSYMKELEAHLAASTLTRLQQMQNFPLYVPRQDLTKFLCRHEIFKRVLNIQGSIVECGVFLGGGLMTWAQLSAIYEPTNHQRRIIGFDTFGGIKSLSNVYDPMPKYDFNVDNEKEIRECIRLYDLNRFVGHVPKVELVRGDAKETIPKYILDNPHLIIGLLVLDFDIFEPTCTAITRLLPRMGKGSIIVADELNNPNWPGETSAVRLKELGSLKWERFPWASTTCFAQL